MQVWGLANCDTSRKALAALRAAGHAVALTDIRDPGLTADQRAALLAAVGERALNRASSTWRGLTSTDQAQPVEALLAAHPALIKRPVILHQGQWSVGWTPGVQAALGL